MNHAMNRVRPLTQDVQVRKLDSSHSRTLLTTRNYRGQRLLRTIKGRPSSSDSTGSDTAIARAGMAKPQNEDIFAPPMSSDEEEESTKENDSRSRTSDSSMKRKADSLGESIASNKRAKKETMPIRMSDRSSQRLKSRSEPEAVAVSEPTSSASALEIPDFLSQSSQQKKQQRKFGKASSYNRSGSRDGGFADPGDLPPTPRKPQRTTATFNAPEDPPASQDTTPPKKMKEMRLPSSAKKKRTSAAMFKVPEEMNHPRASSNTTELSNVFDIGELPGTNLRNRRSSTSSLSSVDSMASYELSETQKDDLANDTSTRNPISAGCILCPICHHVVNLKAYPSLPDPTNLPLRKQQAFCNTHRLDDVDAEWQKNGYPVIDWTSLEKRRIPKVIPHLRQILYRKSPSYYFDHLESKLAEAKGNQSKIRRYLANEIVEVVKPGYYGPRGAKVMGNKVTTEMAHHLKRSLRADDTVRAVGISGFVSAVLLPELLQQLVMQDMRCDENEAREVIGVSTEAGMLLWPDDDHVVVDDNEEGDGVNTK